MVPGMLDPFQLRSGVILGLVFEGGDNLVFIEFIRLQHENHSVVRVGVSDNGPGIAPEYHEKIFDKFGQVENRQSAANGPVGLGLAFCKLAVEAHGGHIGVESRAGEGNTFWFTLPVHGPAPRIPC